MTDEEPTLTPRDLRRYGLRSTPKLFAPGATGAKIWINGTSVGYLPNPDRRLPALEERVRRGEVGGPDDGA